MSKTIGLLLAGGASSRMKADKALLKIGSQSLLSHAHATLSNTALDTVMVSGEKHGGIPDIIPMKGPLSGIHSSLHSGNVNRGDRLLVLPVDIPFMRVQTLNTLVTHSRRTQQSCYYVQSYLPACFVVSECFEHYINRIFETTQTYSVRSLLEAVNAHALERFDTSDFFNVNQPQDWETVNKSLALSMTG